MRSYIIRVRYDRRYDGKLGDVFTDPDWDAIKCFIASLNESTPEGRHILKDEEIYAIVMSYETLPSGETFLESHRNYIDIHTVITGSEAIAWQPAKSMEVRTAYDPEKDVELFMAPKALSAVIDVVPGAFLVFFPADAHMPQLRVGGMTGLVKKAVIKVHTSLFKGL